MKTTARAAVASLPQDFLVSSSAGGAFTILAYSLMAIVFMCELSGFMSSSYSAQPFLDERDNDTMQINFDVDMYDIECRNLRVLVYDELTKEPISALSQDFWLRALDAKGRTYGMAQRPMTEEEHEKEMKELEQQDGQNELDSDWSDSHDGFKHMSFEHVIHGHDFTLINFFAGWCSHCRNFAPTWNKIADKIHGKGEYAAAGTQIFHDRDNVNRVVRLIKLNCVDFQQECKKQGIDAFPTLRLYKADGSFSVFEGKRSEAEILRWIEKTVRLKTYGWSKDHEDFERGCNAKGRIQVPRIPGRLDMKAGGGDQALDPLMTNVSHLVKHLSFSDAGDGRHHRKRWSSLPKDMVDHVTPLDGKSFITDSFHETWTHDIRVVGVAMFGGDVVYRFSEYGRLSRVPVQELPQCSFSFDIEPFSMRLTQDSKTWYQFVTSVMAIMGGVFVMMRLSSVAVNGALLRFINERRQLRPGVISM